MPMITALAWVQRGKAQAQPTRYALNEIELERISKLAKLELDDARIELAAARELQDHDLEDSEGGWEDADSQDEDVLMQDVDAAHHAQDAAKKVKGSSTASRANPDDLSIYNLDDYDKDQDSGVGAFNNVKGLQYFQTQEDDPYVTLKDQDTQEDDREELEIYPTDNLIVSARTEDEVSQLDIYVYDDLQSNLYVHHDLLLPAMPLCLEWLDYVQPTQSASMETSTDGTRSKGSFIAVGTMDPEIEIWSLDVIDGLYPNAILGAAKEKKTSSLEAITSAIAPLSLEDQDGTSSKKKKKKRPRAVESRPQSSEYHVDSVLALAWNRAHHSLLASSSADHTIKLWDMSLGSNAPAVRSFDLHSDKVQALKWCPSQPTVLISGSWDGYLKIFDSRSPSEAVGIKVPCDVECLQWNSWNQSEFLVGLDNGQVRMYDYRSLGSTGSDKSLWTLAAHDKSVSSLDYSSQVQGMLVTGGTDKIVKIWNCADDAESAKFVPISLVASRDLGVGNVFATTFCPDEPTTLAVAGSHGNLQIWDCAANAGVRRIFEKRLQAVGKDVSQSMAKDNGGLIAVDKDSEGEDSGEE